MKILSILYFCLKELYINGKKLGYTMRQTGLKKDSRFNCWKHMKYSILNTHYRNGRTTGTSENTRKEKLRQLWLTCFV